MIIYFASDSVATCFNVCIFVYLVILRNFPLFRFGSCDKLIIISHIWAYDRKSKSWLAYLFLCVCVCMAWAIGRCHHGCWPVLLSFSFSFALLSSSKFIFSFFLSFRFTFRPLNRLAKHRAVFYEFHISFDWNEFAVFVAKAHLLLVHTFNGIDEFKVCNKYWTRTLFGIENDICIDRWWFQ